VRLRFGHADQAGDNCVSMDGVRVDPAGSYALGAAEGAEPATKVHAFLSSWSSCARPRQPMHPFSA
jgi:hypothetical protein